ncbi:hypothetical protein BKA63DRAFT_528239 [Paraphoma chrysanthemicola]|nr:hypothetical protein BKA63DRAFT_528239 [Paraphoma chrysanthemicola]
MTMQKLTLAPSKICSVHTPYYAFLHLDDRVTIYNSTNNEVNECILTGHDITSMITMQRSTLLGAKRGNFVQIPHGSRQIQIRKIEGIDSTPLFLFGGSEELLVLGTGWERTQNHMRCEQVAMVWQGKPVFHTLRGEIVAHQFDRERRRQLFVTIEEKPVRYQLHVISSETDRSPVKSFNLDMDEMLMRQQSFQSVWTVSRHGVVAFIDDGVFFIVSPMSGQTKPEVLFIGNAAVKKLHGHFASFHGEGDNFLIHGAMSEPTALQISIAKYDRCRWNSCMSLVMDVQDVIQDSSLLASSVVRDSAEDDKGLVFVLHSIDNSEEEQFCTLLPMFADGLEAFMAEQFASAAGQETGVSLLDDDIDEIEVVHRGILY